MLIENVALWTIKIDSDNTNRGDLSFKLIKSKVKPIVIVDLSPLLPLTLMMEAL